MLRRALSADSFVLWPPLLRGDAVLPLLVRLASPFTYKVSNSARFEGTRVLPFSSSVNRLINLSSRIFNK